MKSLICIFLLFTQTAAVAQSEKALWKKSSKTSTSKNIKKTNFPLKHLVDLDAASMEAALAAAPKRNGPVSSNAIISLPDGDGKFERFRVYENSVMAPELAKKYPEIRSFFAIGIDNPQAKAYFSHSPLGFKSMTLYSNKSAVFIEPVTDDLSTYTVYKKSDEKKIKEKFECSTKH